MSHNGKIKHGIYIQQNLISHEKEEGTDVCHNVDGTGNITLSERKLPYATGAAKKKKKPKCLQILPSTPWVPAKITALLFFTALKGPCMSLDEEVHFSPELLLTWMVGEPFVNFNLLWPHSKHKQQC